LKNDMTRIPPSQPQTWARQRARVRSQLDALGRQALALTVEIDAATAVGQPTQRHVLELDALRRRSTHLAEIGAALDLQRSEGQSIDHSQPGRRWRPTAAEPF
jgi:hypothetical protein